MITPITFRDVAIEAAMKTIPSPPLWLVLLLTSMAFSFGGSMTEVRPWG